MTNQIEGEHNELLGDCGVISIAHLSLKSVLIMLIKRTMKAPKIGSSNLGNTTPPKNPSSYIIYLEGKSWK